jgi:thiosulfate reductase cytochrome b subunit
MVALLACSAMHALPWIALVVALAGYVWWSSRWSPRAKVIRRIAFYAFMVGYVIVRAAIDKHDWISWALFAVITVYCTAQLVEDIGGLRKSNR